MDRDEDGNKQRQLEHEQVKRKRHCNLNRDVLGNIRDVSERHSDSEHLADRFSDFNEQLHEERDDTKCDLEPLAVADA